MLEYYNGELNRIRERELITAFRKLSPEDQLIIIGRAKQAAEQEQRARKQRSEIKMAKRPETT